MAGLNDPLSQLDYGEQFLRGGPSVTQVSGIAGLVSPERLNIARSTQNSLDRLDQLGSMALTPPPPPPPDQASLSKPVLAISRSTGKIWANGKLFTLDDAQGAIESEQFMGGAPAPAPLAEATDWEPLNPDAYAQHIQQIKNPSLTTLASKNFGIGFDNIQMLGGYGLQFLGAEETGQGIVRQQLEDIRRNEPYQRSLEDVPERGAIEWLVANVAQQGPNIIESIVTLAVGAGAGAVAGGGANPFTAVGGAMTALVGKQTFKQAVLAAVKKYAAGEALDAAEQKLLKEAAGITLAATKSLDDDAARAAMAGISATGRQQAMTGGAVTLSAGQNYTTAVSDLYGESVEGGTPDRGLAALAAIPYTAAETLTEYATALRFFNNFKVRALKAGGKGGRPGALAANVALGAGAGAAVEGGTEAFQETLGIGMNAEIDVNSPEGVSRLLNAFAAGAAVGGLVGGASNMNSGRATDLLSGGTKPAEQNGTTLTSTPALPAPQEMLALPAPALQLPAPPAAAAPAEAPPAAEAPPIISMGDANRPLALPPASTIYVPPTGQQQLLSRARYAPPTERRPQGEMFTSVEMGKGQAPAPVPTGPLAPPSTDMGGEQGALQRQREFPPDYGVSTPAADTKFAKDLIPARRQIELTLAQQQRNAQTPTAAEVDYNDALADQPMTLEINAVLPETASGRLKKAEGERRNILHGFNLLSKEQQDTILGEFNYSEVDFINYVKNTKPEDARRQLAALAGVEPSAFEVKAPKYVAPKPAKPQAAVQPIVEETPNAPEGGKVEQGDKLKRTQNRTGVGGRRVNRNLKTEKQEAGGEAGGGNRLKQGKAAQEEVTPSPKGEGVAATPSKTAAELKAEEKARKAAEAKRMKDIGRVNKAIVDANNAKADERITSLAAVARLGADEKLSSEARALAQDHIATELSELETILLNARLADLGYKDLSPDDKAELAADAIRGSNAVEPNAVPKGDLDEVYSAIATVRQQSEEMKALAGKGNDTPAKREAFKKNVLSLMSWAKGQGVSEQAQWTARAYLEEYKGRTSQDWAGVEQAFDDIDNGRYMLSTFDLVENPIDENGRPAKGVNPVRVKAIVDSFKRGLAKAPQFYVYKNQADLQRRNPSLYQQAVGSRPQGDFDTARASGFAFDGKVLVFTDRIPTEKYMKFLLAHEAIGHFGMRALLPASKFDALMDYVYENNVAVRSAVDSKLGVRPTGVAPMSRRGFLKGTSSVIGAAVVPKMPRIPAKLDVNTFITAYTELRDKLGNINNPDSVGKMGDLFLEILSPIKGKNASDAKQAVNKMDSILDNARRYVDDNMSRTLDNLEQRLEFGPDDDYLTYWFEENEAEAAPLLKQFSSLIEEAYQKRNVEIADHVRSTLNMVKNKLGGSAKTEARSSTSEDVDMLGARREAVEEYMAKYAEKLDSSVITRVWNAIKDVLNKLGIKFEDDIVRYLVSQARSTVRNGSSMFTPSTFALNVHTITTNNGTGRFSTEPIYTDQHAASNAFYLMNAPPASIERVNQTLKDFKINSADTLERIVRTFLRQGNFAALRSHGVEYYQNLLQSMATAAKELVFRFNQRLGALLALNGDSRRMVSNAFVVSRRIANRRYALPKDLRNKALLILGDVQPDETREVKGDEEVIRKLVSIGTLSKKELEDGAEVTYEEPTEDGKFEKVIAKIPGLKELLKRELTQEEYDLYKKTREDLAALDIERLIGQYQNFLATEKISTAGIRKVIKDKNMTEKDVIFVKDIVNHAKNLFINEIDYDERGIASITPKGAGGMEQYFAAINSAVVKKEFTDDLKVEVRKFYLPKPTKDEDGKVKEPSAEALAEGNKKSEAAIKKIEEFRSRRTEFTGKEEQSVIYTLQDRIKEIVLADAAFDKAQAAVRRSIASSHVPLWREGAWQVRVEAQINGKPVKLHPEVQNKMILSLHEKPSESENVAALINEKMKDLEYSGLVYNEETGEYKTQTFKLFAVPSKTVDSVASDPSIDIDNFLYTLRVLGQPLTPDKHAKAITMLTAPGSALRKALRFDDSPGYDPNRTIDAIARHVTTRASLIAKTRYQPIMRELLDRTTELGQKWFGDKEAVMTAKENFDKATDPKIKAYWQDKLATDLYKYIAVNPGAKGWDGSRATFPNQPTKASLGMRDYSDAVKTTDWLMDSANINESTFEGKRYAALAKMVTSVGFLGGVMTQFAQNLMSFATNVFPLLASKDSQTGFGGGFGMAVMPMYLRSFKDANFTGFNAFSDPIKEAQAFNKIATEIKAARDAGDKAKEAELVQRYNLNYYEALNIAREIREGKLIPSQALALLETARGIFTGRFGKGFLKFSDWYMLPFNVSEQATRRASFLTAFRLEFDRLKQAGFNEDKASEMARAFAVKIIDGALGNYDASNRPPIWRDGLMSMLFVYKTFPLTSLSLFKNLSYGGKIGMLTALWVLAGAAGFPLVDDMEDFIDTLAQRLGLDFGQGPSVRMAIINQLEEVFPGWSDMILRGPLNHYTGADVGAKFGLEDFIPGTGILLKGANTTEELKSIAGPVIGMGLSMGEFAYDAIRAPLSSTVSAVDVLRESPFSLMRAGGDVAAYLQNGAIVDRRGYVVSPEVSAMTVVSRLLGFYPADAARQYDFIKYANRMNYDYKEIGMAYKLAWIKAKKAGNEREAARIVREVNEWNEANRGGPGFLRNFLKNAQRQLKEANRPAGERFLKAAPVASRAEYDRFLEYITGE